MADTFVRHQRPKAHFDRHTFCAAVKVALDNNLMYSCNPFTVRLALTGIHHLQILPLSIAKVLFAKAFGKLLNLPPGRPEFKWEPNGQPELVDWIGQKNQIDLAKKLKLKQVVVVSSMGGSQADNFLNTIGKKEDGTGGDILLWKRKAEKYLIDSGVKYTIIHPGGLIDKDGGKREIVMDIDDKLLKREKRSIPRADVAEVCVKSLLCKSAINRSIDICTNEEGEGAVTTNFDALFKGTKGNCNYKFMGNPM